jgi:hypothetical protein
MSNLRIVPRNDWDDATLTVSTAAETGFQVENTQNTIRDKKWRTASNATQSITGVWDSSRTVSHFSMHRHKNHAGNIRVQLYSDAGATVQVYDSGTVSAVPYTVSETYTWSDGSNDPFQEKSPYWLWFSPTIARSVKVTFSGTSANFYEASRLWLGRYMEFSSSPDFGAELGVQDLTDRERTQGGSLRTNESETWRTMKLDLHNVRPTEYATLLDIMDYATTSKDVVVSVYPGDGTRKEALYTMAGRLSNLNSIARQVSRYTGRIMIEEN